MKKALTITLLFLLVAMLSFCLIACQKDDVELKVTFDDSTTYTLEELTDTSGALHVEIVSNKGNKKVAFHIESSQVTEDGKYIELVISASGLTKTVLLPYGGKEAASIRTELRPLYKLLSSDGDKSFALTLDGESTASADAETDTFAWKALLNILSDDVQFALLSGTPTEDGTMTYDKSLLSFSGVTPNVDKYRDLLDLLLDAFDLDVDLDALLDSDEDADIADETQDTSVAKDAEDPALADFFIDLSRLLDTMDELTAQRAVALTGVEISKADDVYHVKGDSKKLVRFLKAFLDKDSLGGIAPDTIIDFIDTQTDGAFKQGKIALDIAFGIKSTTATFSLRFENSVTGEKWRLTLSAEISATPFDIPQSEEAGEVTGSDLELSIPLSLPQKGLSLTLTAVIHLSNLLSEESDELITATLDFKDTASAAVFVLNDAYAYLDFSGFARAFRWSEATPTTFRYTFEKDGEPASFFDVLPDLLNGILHGEDEEEEDASEEDPLFAHGYSVSVKEDADLKFHIGATEQDLRDRLVVCTYDEEDTPIPFENYTVEGFDPSASFNDEIKIVFDADHTWDLSVLIYDPNTAEEKSLVSLENIFEKGTSVADAQAQFLYKVRWGDGTIFWDEEAKGLTFVQIYSPTFSPLSSSDSLDSVGTYTLMSVAKGNLTAQLWTLYVYDPENLIVKGLSGSTDIGVESDATIEDLRNALYIVAIFDNGSEQEVTDYEIAGFAEDATSVTVTYQGQRMVVTLVRTDEDIEEPKSLTDYLRFTNDSEDAADLPAALLTIYRENKDLFDALFTVTKTESGVSLHLKVNAADDKDLFAVLNLFLGIPAEEGWTDIDENNFTDLIAELFGDDRLFTIDQILALAAKTSLTEMLSDLAFNATLSWEDGIAVMLSLADSEQKEYLHVGISARSIEATAPAAPTEQELLNAHDFDDLGSVLFLLLSALLV